MISWIIIVVLVIIGIMAIKMNHLRHRFFIVLLLVLALFLYITINYVNKQNNLDFSTAEGVVKSMKVYMGWLAHGFGNLKSITGYAIHMNWTSTNGTIKLKSNQSDTGSANAQVNPNLPSVKVMK